MKGFMTALLAASLASACMPPQAPDHHAQCRLGSSDIGCDRLLDMMSWFQERATEALLRAKKSGHRDLIAAAGKAAAKFDGICSDLHSSGDFDEKRLWSAFRELMGVEQELDVREQ